MPSIQEFSQKLKEKYPQYSSIDDTELALKMLEKHPEYRDRVFSTDPEIQAKITPPEQPVVEEPGIMGSIANGAKDIYQNVKNRVVGLGDAAKMDAANGQFNPVLRSMGTVGGAAGDIAAGVVKTGYEALVPEGAKDAIKSHVLDVLDTDLGRAGVQALKSGTDSYEAFKKENPSIARTIEDVFNVASIIPIGKGAGIAAEGAVEGAKMAGKAGMQAAGTAGKAAADTGKYVAGQTFGLNKDTVDTIIKNPSLFSAKDMAKIDRESLFGKVKKALDTRMDDLSETGKGYKDIRELPITTSVSENTVLEKLAERGIEVKDGKIDVNLGSDIQLSNADKSGLEEVLGLLQGKESLTPKEVLNLRKRLTNLSGFAEGRTDASSIVAKEIRSVVDGIAKKEIPGLEDLDRQFASEAQFLGNVKGLIFDKKGNVKDSAVSAVANLTGKGKEMKLARIEKLVPGITEDVRVLKAVEDVVASKSQKVGTYFRGMAGGAAGLSIGGPLAPAAMILSAIATSPQVGVALIRGYGKAKGLATDGVNAVIKKMKSGEKLEPADKKIVLDSIKYGSDKLKGNKASLKGNPTVGETAIGRNGKIPVYFDKDTLKRIWEISNKAGKGGNTNSILEKELTDLHNQAKKIKN